MVVVWIGVRNFWMFFIVFVSFWLFCVFSESYHGLYIVEYFFKTAVDAQYVPVQYFFLYLAALGCMLPKMGLSLYVCVYNV